MKPPTDPGDILIIDDDPDILLMLQVLLQEEGYRVRITESGSQGERLCQEDPPALLILDLLLSGEDGRHVVQRLKQSRQTRQIPVVMMSAHPSAEHSAREAGVNAFLAKPFEIDQLLEVVHTLFHQEA